MSTNSVNLEFEPGEAFVMAAQQVAPEAPIPMLLYSLTLTNRNIYLTKNGLLGNPKEVTKYPLSDLIVTNGIPQAFYRKSIRGMNVLDLYMTTGQVTIIFNWKKEIKKWVDAINNVMKSIPDTSMQEPSTQMVSRFCSRCGASVSGIKETTIKCPYCDSFITLD